MTLADVGNFALSAVILIFFFFVVGALLTKQTPMEFLSEIFDFIKGQREKVGNRERTERYYR